MMSSGQRRNGEGALGDPHFYHVDRGTEWLAYHDDGNWKNHCDVNDRRAVRQPNVVPA
jgi:hypothetical protein